MNSSTSLPQSKISPVPSSSCVAAHYWCNNKVEAILLCVPVHDAVLMRISGNLHTESREVSIKTRWTPDSISLKGQPTKQTQKVLSLTLLFSSLNLHTVCGILCLLEATHAQGDNLCARNFLLNTLFYLFPTWPIHCMHSCPRRHRLCKMGDCCAQAQLSDSAMFQLETV